MDSSLSTGLGPVTAYAGSALGSAVVPVVSKAFSGVSSPLIQSALIQGTSGALSGFGIGAGVSLLQGDSIGTAVSVGENNALFGLGAGLTSGLVAGLKESRELGLNPLTGKPKNYALPELSGRIEIRTEPESLE